MGVALVSRKVARTAAEFDVDLNDWVRVKVKPSVSAVKVAVANDLFHDLNYATPVGNPDLWSGPAPKGYVGGTARASWFFSADRAGTEIPVKNTPGMTDVSGFAPDSNEIWVANNLPYIQRIMEEGWSGQAPTGTFSAVVERIKAKWGLS